MEKNTGRVFLVKHLKLIVLFEHFKLIAIPQRDIYDLSIDALYSSERFKEVRSVQLVV